MILGIMLIRKSVQNGFTMIEALLALFVTLIVSLCMVIFLRTCLLFINYRPNHQDQFAILQLRQIVAVSKDINVENGCLHMLYEHRDITVEFDRNRIVKKDGYEILMEDVEDAYFLYDNEKIYLIYEKGRNSYKIQIM